MKTTKPTPPTGPNETDAHTVYELGLVKKSIPHFHINSATDEETVSHFSASLPDARIQKIRERIAALNLEQCEDGSSDLRYEQANGELLHIERLACDGSLRALGKKDPFGFALKALERWLDIVETEQHRRAVDTGNTFIPNQTREGKLGPVAKRIKAHLNVNSKSAATRCGWSWQGSPEKNSPTAIPRMADTSKTRKRANL